MYVSVDGNDFPDILFTVKLGSLIYFDIFEIISVYVTAITATKVVIGSCFIL